MRMLCLCSLDIWRSLDSQFAFCWPLYIFYKSYVLGMALYCLIKLFDLNFCLYPMCYFENDSPIIHYMLHWPFDLVQPDLSHSEESETTLSRSSHEKLFCFLRFFWKNLPEREDYCDDLLLFATTPSNLATSHFEDENFILEGKSCKT